MRKLLGTLLLLANGAAAVVADGPAVAVWADSTANLSDVRAKVSGAGAFRVVDTWNVSTQGVPTLNQALAYDAIMIFGGSSGWDANTRTALGDVLADYADAGRGVVTTTFVLGSNAGSWILGGRFNSDRYHVMNPVASQIAGRAFLGTVLVPDHPIMAGVTTFDGGSSSYRVPLTGFAPGSLRIADWTDGLPLVASKELTGLGRRADLNFYPPSNAVRSDFWNAATDGDLLMANALQWVAVPEPTAFALLLVACVGLRRGR